MTQSLEKSRTVFCFLGASFRSCAFLLSSSPLSRISFSFKALIRAWYLTLTKSLVTFSGMSGNKLLMKQVVCSRTFLQSFTLAPSPCIKLNAWSQFMTIFKVLSVGALKPPWLLREMNSWSSRTPRGRSSCNILSQQITILF